MGEAAATAPAVAAGAPAGAVIEAGCSYDGRQLKGKDGDLFKVSCPAGCESGRGTRGTGVYSAHSAICRAGIHAGAIPKEGGVVTVRLEPGRPAYRGSLQNGIKSSDHDDFRKSDAVVVDGSAPAAAGAQAAAAAAPSVVIEAGCSYDARQLAGNDGDVFKVSCPDGCESRQGTWGTGVYTAHSAICRAGIHAGAIPKNGGTLSVRLEAGRPAYRGSVQNGIESSDHDDYRKSFAVVMP